MATVKEINAERASRVAQGLDPYTGTKAGGAEAVAAGQARSSGTSGVTQQGYVAPTGVTLDTTKSTNPPVTASKVNTPTSDTPPSQTQQTTSPTTITPQTATPSATTQATPEQIQQVAQATPEQIQQVAQATQAVNDLTSRYKAGLANTKAAEPNVAATRGQAEMAIQKYTPGAQPTQPEAITNFFTPENPVIQESTKQLQEWLNPEADRKLLNEHIEQLSADRKALAGMKTELMNINRIMDGTAEDIAKEVESAGGFASSSQVAALAIARNSTLLKKAQLISDQIQSQTDLVNADVSLVGMEKEMAATQFSQRLSLYQIQQQNNDRMFNAFKDTVKQIQETAGWAGLKAAYADNPRQLAYVESLYGGKGSLDRLAAIPKVLTEQEKADLAYTKAQTANLYSQIEERKNTGGMVGTITGKPQNASQSAANGYADRMAQADIIISNLGKNFISSSSIGGSLPNFLQSGDRQTYEQAKKNFVTAVLRRESGASIAPSEFETAESQYFPQRGDKPDVLKAKENLRNTVINNFYREANVNRPVLPGQIIESEGVRYKVGDDGVTLTKI